MRRLLSVTLVGAALAVSLCPLSPAQSPPPQAKNGKTEQKAEARPIPLDKLQLPPGSVVVLTDDIKEALKQVPRLILLAPEKYQEIMDRLAQFERQLKVERRPPSSCKLRAAVEGDLARLEAEFAFTVEQSRTVVALGCRGAQLLDARIRRGEGESAAAVPLLDLGPDGYSITPDAPGDYLLTLAMRVPLAPVAGATARSRERSFELSLPGTAITTLTLDLPHAVKEVHWNQVVEKARPAGSRQKHWENIPLGKVVSLTVSWQEPPPANDAGPLLTAKGQILVHLEETQAVTTAELSLTDLRAQTRQWRLWLPPKVQLKIAPPEGVAYKLQAESDNVHTLHLSEPTEEPVKVTVMSKQPRPFQSLGVGPFTVLDAFSQEGTIEVRATPQARRGVRFDFETQPLVEERDVQRELAGSDLVGLFRYKGMPLPAASSPQGKNPENAALLTIKLKPAQGRVETHVEHQLRLRPRGGSDQGALIEVATRILAKPLGDFVDFLEVQLPRARPEVLPLPGTPWLLRLPSSLPALPQESEWLVGGAEIPFADDQAKLQRKARLRLLPAAKETTLILTGTYSLPPGVQSARLELPRPLASKEGRGKVQVAAEGGLELLFKELGAETPAPNRTTHGYDTDSAPVFVDLAWRPFQPELAVTVEADVTFHDRDAEVRQQLTVTCPEPPAGAAARSYTLQLRVPASVRSLTAAGPWEILKREPRDGTILMTPKVSGPPREPLVLTYGFDLPSRDDRKKGRPKQEVEGALRSFEVPLAVAEQATSLATRVRIWTQPGTVPVLADGNTAWKERGPESVPGRGLPNRVYVGDESNLPLRLRLEPVSPQLPGVVIDRVLVQVTMDWDGSNHYRVDYAIGKHSSPYLELKIPAPAAAQSLEVKAGGLPSRWEYEAARRIVKIPLGAGAAGPVVLKVAYRLPRNQPVGERLWQTSLHPPEAIGNVLLGRVRWQVTLPPGWLGVPLGADLNPEMEWGWRGWLPGPQPSATTAQLEQWVTGQAGDENGAVPSLVCSRTNLEPLRLLRPPLQVWFLLCSGTLLLLGLILYALPQSKKILWWVVGGVAVAAFWMELAWPSGLQAFLYGCLPGAVVLAALLGSQWIVHHRYRRQVVFMPGFQRVKAGSSLVQSTNARPHEPSTIDAPASAAGLRRNSSVRKTS